MEDLKLKNIWILCSHKKSISGNLYDQNITKIIEIDSVIKFWQVMNNFLSPSKLFYKEKDITSLSFFKKGILPMWEDPKNKTGAEIQVKYLDTDDVDNNWLLALIASIGEVIDDSICGVRIVNSLKFFRLEVWFSCKKRRNVIEQSLKKILNQASNNYTYKEHE